MSNALAITPALGWQGRFGLLPIVHPFALAACAVLIALPFLAGHTQPLPVGAGMVASLILSPIIEEAFFRGWLWQRLQHWRWPVLAVALTTYALFVAVHGWPINPSLWRTAAIYTFARHHCRSVYASMGLHALNNVLAVYCLSL